MRAIAETMPLETAECGGPVQYAERLATYIGDPSRIRSLTVREYGDKRAPSLKRCAELRALYLRRREAFKALSEGPVDKFDPDNDNGEVFKVASLIPQERPPRYRCGKLIDLVKVEIEPLPRLPDEIPVPLGARIVALSAAQFNLTPAAIRSSSRLKNIVAARHVAVRVLRDQIEDGQHRFSLKQIAILVGRGCHTSIVDALKRYDAKAKIYPAMQEARERVGAMLDEG